MKYLVTTILLMFSISISAYASQSSEILDFFPAELQTLGIKNGLLYGHAKQQLLANNWKIITDDEEISMNSEHPEVLCNEEIDAMCSVSFVKDDIEYELLLKNSQQGLIIVGVY